MYMFMSRNRKLNGAADPGTTAKSDASAQKAQKTLSTNEAVPAGESRTFMPNLPAPEVTNREFVRRFEKGDWDNAYEAEIPYGPRKPGKPGPGETDAKLGKMGK